MDIKIPDNWLREFLDTKATPSKVMEYLSLCGPSVERITNNVYEIEITTNRIDCVGVYGIAREASAILPRFGIDAKLKSETYKKTNKFKFVKKVKYLDVVCDFDLCQRFTAVLIKNVKIGESPKYIKERLAAVGVNPINNVVDISNYVMHELGQPVHTFDYDKIADHRMILRQSKKGENLTTLDGKQFELSGGDIVIEDGSGSIIDLCGIMGGESSAIDANTQNVLLFVQRYDPIRIRKTTMSLAKRSEASQIFEKGTDPELVEAGVYRCIELFQELTKGEVSREILDLYPNPYKSKALSVKLSNISQKIGIEIPNSDIEKYLTPLGFAVKFTKDTVQVTVPSHRSADTEIPEDVIEEIARIYGYHNLPSTLMTGIIPDPIADAPFEFENNVKQILKNAKGVEVYTLSLVDNDDDPKAYKLKNPLSDDAYILRTSLYYSITNAAKQNAGIPKFHMYEISNIYIPTSNNLPDEKMTLAGVFKGYNYRDAKGVIESLLAQLNIEAETKLTDLKNYQPSHGLELFSGKTKIGEFGVTNDNLIYYEFDMLKLKSAAKSYVKYTPISKYPAQVEDLTIIFPDKTKMGEVVNTILNTNPLISEVSLTDIYEDSYTFNIKYLDKEKTLTDTEVAKVRDQILKNLHQEFGGNLK